PGRQPHFDVSVFYPQIPVNSFHPETPDLKLLVLNAETRDFLSWQETFACKSRQRRLSIG
ncbi:MAG: hypothetical protein PHO83_18100, partial [Geobacteraceae bacterium]|nr:hypothetical protein [Geobacteraceae bacterium]